MIKNLVASLIALILLVSLAGCGIKQKIEDEITAKVGKAITEGVLDQALGDEGDVDIENGKFTIKSENGEEATLGGTEWPSGQAADLLPKFDKGTIDSVVNSALYSMIIIEEVEDSAYADYQAALKGAGFSENAYEASAEDAKYYTASKDEKTVAALSYGIESKELIITVSIQE